MLAPGEAGTIDQLRTKDLRAIIEVAQALGDIDDAGEFNASILPLLGRLVPSDLSTLNVIDPTAGIALRPADRPVGLVLPARRRDPRCVRHSEPAHPRPPARGAEVVGLRHPSGAPPPRHL